MVNLPNVPQKTELLKQADNTITLDVQDKFFSQGIRHLFLELEGMEPTLMSRKILTLKVGATIGAPLLALAIGGAVFGGIFGRKHKRLNSKTRKLEDAKELANLSLRISTRQSQ